MRRLWILDKTRFGEASVLVPLKTLLSKLPLDNIDAWTVRELEAQGVVPFGAPMAVFEALTDRLTLGLLLTPSEFANLTTADVQILNGEFAGLSFRRPGRALDDFKMFTVKCIDSAVWECESDDNEIISAIRNGFAEVQEPSTKSGST